MKAVLKEIEAKLGHEFTRPELLKTAFTHSSYVAEANVEMEDNQRLEFLGDAVLQVVLSDLLFRRYPDVHEGRLTKMRAALANSEALADLAQALDLGKYMRLGKGEEQNDGRQRRSTLADAMEAVLAALYLDGGMEAVMELCRKFSTEVLQNVEETLARENPKGTLQELTQELGHGTPTYEILSVEGPEHEPEFAVSVSVAGNELALARGSSRKRAEKAAAELAIAKLQPTGETPGEL
jgi:ribonuclease-3